MFSAFCVNVNVLYLHLIFLTSTTLPVVSMPRCLGCFCSSMRGWGFVFAHNCYTKRLCSRIHLSRKEVVQHDSARARRVPRSLLVVCQECGSSHLEAIQGGDRGSGMAISVHRGITAASFYSCLPPGRKYLISSSPDRYATTLHTYPVILNQYDDIDGRIDLNQTFAYF